MADYEVLVEAEHIRLKGLRSAERADEVWELITEQVEMRMSWKLQRQMMPRMPEEIVEIKDQSTFQENRLPREQSCNFLSFGVITKLSLSTT